MTLQATTADYYEAYWSESGFSPHGYTPPPLRALLERTIQPGSSCLDLGCGDGRTTGLWLRDRGCGYTGVDVSANAVAAASTLGLRAQQIKDAADLPFPDASFDAIVCIEVLEHLFQPQLAALEAARVLKPGGLFLVTVPNSAYWRRRIDLALLGRWNPLGDNLSVQQPWRDPHIRFFTRSSLRNMLLRAGFANARVGGHGGSLFRDLPWVGTAFRRPRASIAYRLAERCFPALLGYALYAVALKAGSLSAPLNIASNA